MKVTRSVADAAEEILLNVRHPLHYKVLTPMLLEQCNLHGKTPHESVRSSLATNPKFKRIAEGMFALSIWEEYPAIRFAKDIAYDALKKENKPISLVMLGQKILAEREFKGGPAMVARGVLNTDKRFSYDRSSGMVSLIEWDKS
jgi:hypothetical protein